MKNTWTSRSLFDSASRWIRNALTNHAEGDTSQLTGGEFERIAHDLNLSASELHALCAKGGQPTQLLRRRMSRLRLDKDALRRSHPAVVRDLEKVCALCTSEDRCRGDLEQSAEPAGWAQYCPNATTLQELSQQAAPHEKPVRTH